MELESIMIPTTNRFASLYLKQAKPVKDFFHYDLNSEAVFNKRYDNLLERSFHREALADCIEQYMKPFPQSEKTKFSLKKLRRDDAVVVIGGQQAGLLTGPLYTIHKIISIIKLAKEQEEQLQKPVIPIFWIAGEDHDYLEVNHVYIEKDNQLQKVAYPETPLERQMMSAVQFNKGKMRQWVRDIFEEFGETNITNDLLAFTDRAIETTTNLVDFFAYLICGLFQKEGLLIIDSANKQLRQLEKTFFAHLIENHEAITEAVLHQQEMIAQHDFPPAISLEDQAANLFFYNGKERILLFYDKQKELFVGKNNEVVFTKTELLEMLNKHPDCFSNNVLTRPLMQEWLFPTLAFIAGPGEIAYWGELKQAFEVMGFAMPPIIPRLQMTLIERSVEADIAALNLSLESVLLHGTKKEKEAYLQTISDKGMEEEIVKTSNFLKKQYEEIEAKMHLLDKGLVPIVEKNLSFHLRQLEFLQRKTEQSIQMQHEVTLEKYDRIERFIRPDNTPQERIWNIFYFLNKYGLLMIDDLMSLSYPFNGTHQIVKL